jgi:predicted HicB family RNase H-like nuclease
MGIAQVSDDLEYKGYRGSVEFSAEDQMLFGKVLFVDSLLMYHGSSIAELILAFNRVVDSYLLHCEKSGKSPNKPYSGTFNVRVGAARHRDMAQLAYRRNQSINELVCLAVDAYLPTEGAAVVVNHQHNHHHHHETVYKVIAEEESVLAPMYKEPSWQNQTVQ